jgi:uncharacterized membrane protein HdeD (DUF308 family)
MTTEIRKTVSDIWWLFLLQGIATLILGGLLIISPGMTTAVLVQFLGAYWLVSGIFSIIGIFVGDREIHWGWFLLNGVLGILAGISVLNHPLLSTIMLPTMLVYLIAIEGIIMGIVSLINAFKGGGWGAGVWGVVSIIFHSVWLAPFGCSCIICRDGRLWRGRRHCLDRGFVPYARLVVPCLIFRSQWA